jgi:N-acetylglucosaminyldiphosphoundecaprenol N-acetyl-beta-D-mannosaminyltransferase
MRPRLLHDPDIPGPDRGGQWHHAVDARSGLAAALPTRWIGGMRVDATSYEDATSRILRWARGGESRYICVATAHNVVEAQDDSAFLRLMNEADLVTPDGMPLVWALRMFGAGQASRVYGPDLTPMVCARAAEAGVPVGFYGGTPDVLESLVARLRRRFPTLRVAYRWSPPFRALTSDEDARVTDDIVRSGARVVFVGLGTPKQELWMARHRGRIPAAMVGVGAAFDFLSGTKKQAPRWMQRNGLEWLFRLAHEPRRLWKRYVLGNPRFIALLLRQVVFATARRAPLGSMDVPAKGARR